MGGVEEGRSRGGSAARGEHSELGNEEVSLVGNIRHGGPGGLNVLLQSLPVPVQSDSNTNQSYYSYDRTLGRFS